MKLVQRVSYERRKGQINIAESNIISPAHRRSCSSKLLAQKIPVSAIAAGARADSDARSCDRLNHRAPKVEYNNARRRCLLMADSVEEVGSSGADDLLIQSW